MSLRRQIARFGATGVLATLTHLTVGVALHRGADIPAFEANIYAFLIALCVTLYGNTKFTFAGAAKGPGPILRALAVIFTGLGLNQAIVYGVETRLGWPYEAALVAIILCVPAVTFVLFKFWAFRA